MSETPPPVLVVSGRSPVGEAATARAAQVVRARLLGPWRWLTPAMWVAIAGGWIVGNGVVNAYGGSRDAFALVNVVAVLAAFMAPSLTSGQVRRVAIRRWAERGLPGVVTLTYAIDDEALVLTGAVSTTRLRWEGVSEVAPSGRGLAGRGYWIIPAAGLFFYLPRRFFPTAQDETAFIAAMLARMTPAARARSVEARKLTAFE